MAITTTAIWEFRATATANMVNGGGFKPGATGVDYSLQDAAQYALTGIVSAGAGNVFLTASAAADMVGNIAHVISGTNFTAGWFEITSVSVGVSVTCSTNLAGTAISTGVGANGVINIGGALDLAGALQDSFFEQLNLGQTVYIKQGAYTLGGAVAVSAATGTNASPINILGYASTRGDNPTGSTRPVISCGANNFQVNVYTNLRSLIFTGTGTATLALGTDAELRDVKVTNTSTTAARVATAAGAQSSLFNCEAISQNGFAFATGGLLGVRLNSCYAHDSNIGINSSTTTNAGAITNTIVASCITNAIDVGGTSGTTSLGQMISNCTLYGSAAKIGSGVIIPINTQQTKLYNNIITGFATGINKTTTLIPCNSGAYNDFYNNTADVSNYTKDSTDIALDPQFVNVSEVTGSTATTSGSVLTQAGADFSNITDNVDFLRVTSGTSVTTGIYLITAHDNVAKTLTVNNALGTSSAGNVVFTVPVGHNYSIGTNLKGVGAPGVFPGALTTGYYDIGAVQRQETDPPPATGKGGLMFMA